MLNYSLGLIPLILLVGIGAALVSALVTATRSQPKRQYKLVQEAVESPQSYTFTDAQMEVREDIPEENRESLASSHMKRLWAGMKRTKRFIFLSARRKRF